MKNKLYETGEIYSDFSNLEMLMPETNKNVTVYKYKDRNYNAHLRFMEIEEIEGQNAYVLTEIFDFNHHTGIDNILTQPRCNIMNSIMNYIDKNSKE